MLYGINQPIENIESTSYCINYLILSLSLFDKISIKIEMKLINHKMDDTLTWKHEKQFEKNNKMIFHKKEEKMMMIEI